MKRSRPFFIITTNNVLAVTQDLIIDRHCVDSLFHLPNHKFKKKYSQFAKIDANIFLEIKLVQSVVLLTIDEILRIYRISNNAGLPITIDGIPAINERLILADKTNILSVEINDSVNSVDIKTAY